MKRFTTRIIICLVPILVSLGVLFWPPGFAFPAGAYWKYQEGQGGFRIGVDLAGGTILVYEVDESRMPEGFKAEDLAAALKRRIDPADLYNITIRPIAGNPPRVEIILPTGGKHQEQAEQRNWEKVLAAANEKYPSRFSSDNNPYETVPRVGGGTALVEAIRKSAGITNDDDMREVNAWVAKQMGGGAGSRRVLTSEEVENIKSLIERQGRLEFRILANRNDDIEAISAAERMYKDLTPAQREELEKLERSAEPPLPPRNEGGGRFFSCALGENSVAEYSWVELGKTELYSLGLNSEALSSHPAFGGIDKAIKARGGVFLLAKKDGQMDPNLYYVRPIVTQTRRSAKDQAQGKVNEFFVLVRNPDKGKEITGDYLSSASEGFDNSGQRAIDFKFNPDGAVLFRDITTRNKPSGSIHRQLAILFDSQVVSAPNLQSVISSSGQITGQFTQQQINDMVRILRAGALPATLKKDPVSQNTMGPTLGESTIRKGTLSVLLAFLAVLVFMVFYYRIAGVVACIALVANLLLTVAFMVLVQAAFTLPGLAGLVLTLGMAVDANVLIYERLREERERGASLQQALRNGYERAFPTILDTHLTSIFTAIVLYAVGNDQLKGFGISLTVGLIISLFTALYMTRTMFEIGLAKKWFLELKFFDAAANWLHQHYVDFMRLRKVMFAVTIGLTVAGGALFISRINAKSSVLNIDFTGGVALTAPLSKEVELDELQELLHKQKKEDGSSYKVPSLPDLSVEVVHATGSTADKKDYFVTVRTSLREEVGSKQPSGEGENLVLQTVNEYVTERLGDKLLRIRMKAKVIPATVEKGSKGPPPLATAILTFTTVDEETGKNEPAFASPAQVQLLLAREFRKKGVSGTAFTLERGKNAKVEMDRVSELEVILKEADAEPKLAEVLTSAEMAFANNPQPERLEQFDPQLAASTQERALYAILASWGAILFYLWFRFGNWTFGLAAVLCLIHDLFFTLGAIAVCHYIYTGVGPILGIADFKIDLPAIAALLTLVGYSVNDTIVVFDRIREVRGKNPLLTVKMINDSVNQTLTRTILASLTVFLVVGVLYIWGGEGVKLFAFVMVIGVVVGTYSSIYIASPLLLIFGEGAQVSPAELDKPKEPEEPGDEEEVPAEAGAGGDGKETRVKKKKKKK